MRISDWSSDVCSSDLGDLSPALAHRHCGPKFTVGAIRLLDSQVFLIPAVFEREMFLKLIVGIAIEQAEGNLAKRNLLALVEFDLAIAQHAFDPGWGLASSQIRRAQEDRKSTRLNSRH